MPANALLSAPPSPCPDPDAILFQQILDGIERAAWEQKTPTMEFGESLACKIVVWFAR